MAERLDIIVSERGAKVVSRNIRNVGKAGTSAAKQVDFLKRALFLLGGAVLVRKIVQLADSFVLLQNQIKVASDGTGDLAVTTDRLFRISNKTRTAIVGNVQLFQRLSFAAKELGASQEDLFGFVEQTGKLLAIQGGSAQAARGALIQLTQAMGSGIVRGEEFNSILEGAFSVALAAAKGLDRAGGSVSKLRNLIIKGEVTSRQFFEAIQSQSKETDAAFALTVATIGQSFNILETEATKFFGALGQSTGSVDRFAAGIQLLAVNLDVVATALGAVATVILVQLARAAIPAVIAGIAAMSTALLGLATVAIPALTIAALGIFSFLATASVLTGKSIGEVFDDIKGKVTGVLKDFIGTADTIGAFEKRITSFREEIQDLGGMASLTQEQLGDLIGRLTELRDEVSQRNLVQKLIAPASEAVKDMSDQIVRVDEAITALQKRVKAAGDPGGAPAPAKKLELSKGELSSLRSLRDELDAVGKVTRELAKDKGTLSKALQLGVIDIVEYDRLMEGLGKRTLVDMRSALEEVIPALERQREIVEEINEPTKKYKQTMEDLDALYKRQAISLEQLNERQREARIALLGTQKTAAAGAKSALLEINRDIEDFAANTKQLITGAFETASDALAEFVQTGKFEFGDFIRQISSDLVKLGSKELLSGLFTGAKGGGLGELLGTGLKSLLGFLPGFANGGEFRAGATPLSGTIPGGGVDNQLVAFRARRGESVVVGGGSGGRGGGSTVVNLVFPGITESRGLRENANHLLSATARQLSTAGRRDS